MAWSGWLEVPGGQTTDVALGAYGAGETGLLACTGRDQHIYLNGLDAHGAWSGWWEPVSPLPFTTDVPPALYATGGHVYVFAKGINDRQIHEFHVDEPELFHWRSLPGDFQTDAGVSVEYARGARHLFAKGIDDRIYENINADATGQWGGWHEVWGDGTTDRAVSVASDGGTLYLFAKGIADRQFYLNIDSGGGWGGWHVIPGGGTTDVAPNAVVSGLTIYLFGKGIRDRRIYLKKYDTYLHDWGPWEEIPGNGTTDVSLAGAAYGPGNDLYVFAKGIIDHRVYMNIET
jgi:hypothetical protein